MGMCVLVGEGVVNKHDLSYTTTIKAVPIELCLEYFLKGEVNLHGTILSFFFLLGTC